MDKHSRRSQLYKNLHGVLVEYAKREACGFSIAIRDALTDLRHMSDDHAIDFEDRLKRCLKAYLSEKGLLKGPHCECFRSKRR